MNRSMTKHEATAVIILREQVTGEWRPDSRGQDVEAKATIFCPRGVLEVEDSPRGPHPWCVCAIEWNKMKYNMLKQHTL